jgi:hypothetical protein
MDKKQKVLKCYFCGNETLMNLVGEYRDDWGNEDFSGYSIYRMFACPVCHKVTLHEEYWEEGMFRYDNRGNMEEYATEEILYPFNTLKGNNLPAEVKEAFESALKTKNINSAVCSMALRRTLEIICAEKGAEGQDLWQKIEDLSKKGVLPPELKHASTITRKYGNIGAHDIKVSIPSHELDNIIEFVQYIIDYLYILPHKLKRAEKRLLNAKEDMEVDA